MKIGIWLPISPLSDWKYEGLVRLLGFVLSGIDLDQKDTYQLMVPYWVKSEDIEEFLSKFSAEQRQKIEFQRYKRGNILLQFAVQMVEKRKDTVRHIQSGAEKIAAVITNQKTALGNTVSWGVSTVRWSFVGLLMLLLLGVMGLIVGIFAMVFLLPIYIIYRLLKFVLNWMFGGKNTLSLDIIRNSVKKLRDLFSPINFFRALTENELKYLAKNAGRKNKIDCWYIPHVGYKSGMHLKGPKVFLFADFVFQDAPTGFDPRAVAAARKMFANVLSNADGVIAISHHVARRHIQGVFKYPEEKTHVIPHGYVDISGQLPVLNSGRGQQLMYVEKNTQSLTAASKMIKQSLEQLHEKTLGMVGPIYRKQLDYINKIDFSKTDFIVVSTQNRPYKNTLGVVKALEQYNKTAARPLKLIMTGDYGIDDPHSLIGNFVRTRGLYFDVLAIPRVPDDVHAALYHCATLAIAASFFEGGSGSFVFDEAVSVGTPVLLSHNLSHNEGLKMFSEYANFGFNPNAPEELAELISSTLSQPEETLYRAQWNIANSRIKNRSWRRVQREYLQVFSRTIATHKLSRRTK